MVLQQMKNVYGKFGNSARYEKGRRMASMGSAIVSDPIEMVHDKWRKCYFTFPSEWVVDRNVYPYYYAY